MNKVRFELQTSYYDCLIAMLFII